MSKLKLTTLATQDDSASVPADTIVNGTAKAWVNFNGTGTVAIRRAFNVSSITDNGTGDYTVNFTTAMADTNYAAHSDSTYLWNGTPWNGVIRKSIEFYDQRTTSSCRIGTAYAYSDGNATEDSPQVSVSIFS